MNLLLKILMEQLNVLIALFARIGDKGFSVFICFLWLDRLHDPNGVT